MRVLQKKKTETGKCPRKSDGWINTTNLKQGQTPIIHHNISCNLLGLKIHNFTSGAGCKNIKD